MILITENEIYQKLIELIRVLNFIKTDNFFLFYGFFISGKQNLDNDDYNVITIPQFCEIDKIQKKDFILYNSKNIAKKCPNLLLHSMIYNFNSKINFIIHLTNYNVLAVIF